MNKGVISDTTKADETNSRDFDSYNEMYQCNKNVVVAGALLSGPAFCMFAHWHGRLRHLQMEFLPTHLFTALLHRFMQDLEDMLGFRPYSFYYYMWRYVSPAVLVVLIIATVIEMAISPAGYNAWVEAEVSVQLVLFFCV